jgi:hypothetical protein
MIGRAQVVRFLLVLAALMGVAVAASERETVTATCFAGCATLLPTVRFSPYRRR